ncbi:MAG: choice-of-anchor N protein [Candidatus Zixiibacteriota bacterium]
MKKTLLLTFIVAVLMVPSAFAVPRLQLYIPGATYDNASDTWVTPDQDFELWVVAAKLNRGELFNVNLVASLASGQAAVDGGLQITNAANVTTTFDAADFLYGTPPSTGDDAGVMPPHGIFPTNYTEMLVTSQTSSPYVGVYDYVDPDDPDTGFDNFGNIYRFNIHTSYSYLHFDAYGFYRDVDGRFIKAPFSHDAESGKTPVPEPATMLLMGLGLAGAGVVRKFKK